MMLWLASPMRVFGSFLMVVWLCTFAFAASRSMFGHESVSWGLVLLAACATRFLISGETRVTRRLLKALCIGGAVAIAGFLIFETVITVRRPLFEENAPGIVGMVYAFYQGGPILLVSLIFALVPFGKTGHRMPS
jgi:hypothetical protein